MKAKLFQIAWHAKEGGKNLPILSLDAHPTLPLLATAGGDSEVHFWRFRDAAFNTKPDSVVSVANGSTTAASAAEKPIEFSFTMVQHQATVNVVRFSPNGQCLASAGDDDTIIVCYVQHGYKWNDNITERHLLKHIIRAPERGDIYSLAWSPDSKSIVAGSVSNTAFIIDVVTKACVAKLTGHSQFVQGVAWDPANAFIVTQSNDRTVRVWKNPATVTTGKAKKPKTEWICETVIKSREMTVPAELQPQPEAPSTDPGVVESKTETKRPIAHHAMYADETVPTFFRRLTWSPDGSLLITPCGMYKYYVPADGAEADAAKKYKFDMKPTTYIHSRDGFSAPIAHLPGTHQSKPSIAVRCAPKLFKLRGLTVPFVSSHTASKLEGSAATEMLSEAPTGPAYKKEAVESVAHNGAFALPYRVISAVATLDAVHVYDSQTAHPIATMAGFHVDKITDLAWSASGSMLFVSSYDGYVSAAAFSAGDFGEALSVDELPACMHIPSEPTFPISTETPTTSAAPTAATADSNTPVKGAAKPRARITPVAVTGDQQPANSGTAEAKEAPAAATTTAVSTLVPRKKITPTVVGTSAAEAGPIDLTKSSEKAEGNGAVQHAVAPGDAIASATIPVGTTLQEDKLPSMFTVPSMASPSRPVGSIQQSNTTSPGRRRITPIPLGEGNQPSGSTISGSKTQRVAPPVLEDSESPSKRARTEDTYTV